MLKINSNETFIEVLIILCNHTGVLTNGPGMSEQLSNLSNEELRKCINDKGYVVPDSCYL